MRFSFNILIFNLVILIFFTAGNNVSEHTKQSEILFPSKTLSPPLSAPPITDVYESCIKKKNSNHSKIEDEDDGDDDVFESQEVSIKVDDNFNKRRCHSLSALNTEDLTSPNKVSYYFFTYSFEINYLL